MNHSGLGNLEVRVMDVIWSHNAPITVPEVHEKLCETKALAYTTTMTVMSRLARKGLLSRREERRPYTYEVRTGREEYYAQVMISVLEEVADREAALAKFVENIDPHDAQHLLKLVAEPAPSPNRPPKGSA